MRWMRQYVTSPRTANMQKRLQRLLYCRNNITF